MGIADYLAKAPDGYSDIRKALQRRLPPGEYARLDSGWCDDHEIADYAQRFGFSPSVIRAAYKYPPAGSPNHSNMPSSGFLTSAVAWNPYTVDPRLMALSQQQWGKPSPPITPNPSDMASRKEDRTLLRDVDASWFREGMRIETNYYSDSFGGPVIKGTVREVRPRDDALLMDAEEIGLYHVRWGGDVSGDQWVYEIGGKRKKDRSDNVTIESVILEQKKKDQVMAAISQKEHTELIFDKWGFGEVFEKGTAISLLFYGTPGTGKTLMGQAIANHVGQPLQIVQSAEIQSSEPGGAERAIKAFFEDAEKKGKVLLFDECDSLIADRNEVGMILGAQINALLTALENYSGVVVFTTNRLGRMDPAFERRVSAKIEFPFPDEGQRKLIWERLIPKKAPVAKEVDFAALAKYPLAGGNIKNAVLNAARSAAYHKKKEIDLACFQEAIEKEVEGLKSFEAALNSQPKIPHLRGGMDVGMSATGGLEIKEGSELEMKLQRRIESYKSNK